jgi:hypothetical protein
LTLSNKRSKILGAAMAGTAANTSSVLAAARRQLLLLLHAESHLDR